MSQATHRVEVPAPSPSTLCIEDIIDRYVSMTFERFECTLVSVAGALAEPRRPEDPERAIKWVALLVESLTGVAVGLAVGQVGAAIRRGFGEPARAAVDRQLSVIARGALTTVNDEAVTPFLDDAASRPLVDELGMQLQRRLRRARPIASGFVRQIDTTIERVAAHQRRTLAMTLHLMAEDDASALVFADHLELGWRYFATLTTGGPEPEVPDDARWRRIRETWRAWARRVDPTRGDADRAPSHEEVVANGFVVRIG